MANSTLASANTASLANWSVDFVSIASTSKSVTQNAIPDPPGYVRSEGSSSKKSKAAVRQPPSQEEVEALRQKRAWDVALAPAKQIPMQGFMLYMSGSGVQIFSMMVVGMLLTNPIKAIMTITNAFAPYSTPGKSNDLLLHKLCFIACQLACVGLGIYKCWSMGLLPTASSDWLAWREPRTVSGSHSVIRHACANFSSYPF